MVNVCLGARYSCALRVLWGPAFSFLAGTLGEWPPVWAGVSLVAPEQVLSRHPSTLGVSGLDSWHANIVSVEQDEYPILKSLYFCSLGYTA